MPTAVSDTGLLLHRRAWRETSALLDVLTPEHGRIGLVVKGYRTRKNMSGLLEPFRELQLSWSGRGELFTLTGAEPGGRQWGLTGQRLYCGLYINELLWRMLPRHDAHPEVYRLYQRTLSHLELTDMQAAPVLRLFEKHLLGLLGFGLLLDIEADQQTPISGSLRYVYDPERGARRSGPGTAIPGASLLALHREQFDQPGQLGDARRLLRSVIEHHLGGVKLHSYALLRPAGGAASE